MHVLNNDRGVFLNPVFNTWIFLSLFVYCLSAQPTIIFEEDFDGGIPPDWQISEGIPNDATWQWSASGRADSVMVYDEAIGALFWNNRPAIASPSASNGAMMYNSDAYDSAGIGVGEGPFPGNQIGHLISPIINCQFHPVVYLKFHHYARALRNNPSTLISVSIDDGESWVDFPLHYAVAESQSTEPSAMELIDISSVAGGAPNVRIRFTWSGRYYFWLLDDVQLIEAPDAEIAIQGPYYSPSSFAQPAIFMLADTFRFAANVSNLAQFATDSIALKASLLERLGSQETLLFSDSTIINSLPAFCLDSLILIPNFFIPNLPEGEYRLLYEVQQLNQTDFNDFNNRQSFPFRITANEFAKEDDIDIGLRPLAGGDYEVGNIYHLGSDDFDLYRVEEVTFSAAKDEGEGTLDNEGVAISLYEISEAVAPDFSNFQTNNFDDLTLIGLTDYTFPNSSQNFQFFQTPLLSITGEELFIEGGKRYLLTAKYEGTANSIFHSFNDDIDYARSSTILYRNGWFMEGFGTEQAAVLRLRLSTLTSQNNNTIETSPFSIFPNPADRFLNIDIPTYLDKASLVITNSNGQLVNHYEWEQLSEKEIQQIDVSFLPNGTYHLMLFTQRNIWRSTCVIIHN